MRKVPALHNAYLDRAYGGLTLSSDGGRNIPIQLMEVGDAGDFHTETGLATLLENTKRLYFLLEHGAAVYYDHETRGYFCSYHPRKGCRDTPLQALDLAISEHEKNMKRKGNYPLTTSKQSGYDVLIT